MSARVEALAWGAHRLTGLLLAVGLVVHLLTGLGRGAGTLDARAVGLADPAYLVLAAVAALHAGLGLRRVLFRAGLLRGRQGVLGWSARLQRWSGDLLAFALPFHLSVLALALVMPSAFDGLSARTEGRGREAVAAALVLAAVFHLAGGLRIFWLEATSCIRFQKPLAVLAAFIAAAAGIAWLVRPW